MQQLSALCCTNMLSLHVSGGPFGGAADERVRTSTRHAATSLLRIQTGQRALIETVAKIAQTWVAIESADSLIRALRKQLIF